MPISISARAPPKTPLGELTALHNPLAVFKGPTSNRGKGKEGKGKHKGEEGRERKEGPVKSVKPGASNVVSRPLHSHANAASGQMLTN